MASGKDDLEFLTTQDMEDEYNETAVAGSSRAAASAKVETPASFLSEPEERSWSTPLRQLSLFKESRHPGAAFFHLFFKTLAVLFYYPISKILGGSFVIVCVICILLLAFDFWTVKNVSGRLLVGLRWWNYVKEDGTTEWVFESADDASAISPTDRRLFWWGLYAPAVAWSFLLLWALVLFEFQWLIVIIAALSLSFANIIGYTKCSKDASERIQKFAEQGVAQNIVGAIGVTNIISGLSTIIGKQQAAAQQAQPAPTAQPDTMSV
eukprot:CAMPEP_0118919864 /NCGR_PEP_ID=MMETSP1166-20130328/18776_1 /TAXON_ID=1104430 /ORGANISM="Chrysoreinhardia sp, Strain CCMP3193" /LENGTH=265 /DNA_ID=CAMNT_0006860399 /DNA_START=47 /DNA_END=844 /DNA_ORIENTATION=+